MTGLETTMEHHVILGDGRQGCQAHEYRVFSYQPEIETGCLFQLKHDSSHGAGFGVGQPDKPCLSGYEI